MESRVAETIAKGGQVRSDDNPGSLPQASCGIPRKDCARLSSYYAGTGELRIINGMAPVEEVTAEIERILVPA